jgi:hypothetical protein
MWFKKMLAWFDTTFKNTWLAKLVLKFIHSGDNSALGFAAKKVTAFALMYCVVRMHETYITYLLTSPEVTRWSLFVEILMVDFGFIGLLFGINEVDKRLKKKKDEKIDQNPEAAGDSDSSGPAA